MSNGVTERNIMTLTEALKDLRKQINAGHNETARLKTDNLQLRSELGRLEQRINQITVQVYSGGATSGNNN